MQSGIDSADNFVFILSPDSVASEPCMQELAHAITNGKRLIPICWRKPDQSRVPAALAPINYIFFDDSTRFDAALNILIAAMHTDLAWVRSHTRLQVRALEWQAKNSDNSYLLGGSDLKDAESWLARAASQPIKPTDLQSQYILASRTAATRAQRRNLTIAIGVAVVASALAVVAIIQYFAAKRQTVIANKATAAETVQRKEADHQRDVATAQRIEADHQRDIAQNETRIATAGRVAATAISLKDSQLDLASLLAVEAARIDDSFDTRNARVTLFQSSPTLLTYLRNPDTKSGFIDSIAFSPDGKRFAVGLEDGIVQLWDARALKPLLSLPKQGLYLKQLAFSPDSKTLAIIDFYGALALWNVSGPQPVLIVRGPSGQPSHPSGLAFDPAGKRIAVCSQSGIQVWTLPGMAPLRTLSRTPEPELNASGVAFSQKDPHLIAYTAHGLHLEDGVSGASLYDPSSSGPPQPGSDAAGLLAFSPDGTQIAAEAANSRVGVWKLTAARQLSLRAYLPLGDDGEVMGLAFSPDGKRLAAATNHGDMREWDLESLQLHREYPRTLNIRIRSAAYSSDGSLLLSGLGNGVALVWGAKDSTITSTSTPAAAASSPVTQASASGFIATIVNGRLPSGFYQENFHDRVEVQGRGLHLVLPDPPMSPTSIAISPDGRFVAAASSDGNARSRRLWDISSGTPRIVPFAAKDDGTFALAFNPSGTLLATGSQGGLSLWNTQTGQLVSANIDRNRRPVRSAAFSPDGTQIALVLDGGEVLLLDAATAHQLGAPIAPSLNEFGSTPAAAAFSRDGKQIRFAGPDGKEFLWDNNPADWTRRACGIARRNLTLDEWNRFVTPLIPYHRTCPQFPDGEGVTK